MLLLTKAPPPQKNPIIWNLVSCGVVSAQIPHESFLFFFLTSSLKGLLVEHYEKRRRKKKDSKSRRVERRGGLLLNWIFYN